MNTELADWLHAKERPALTVRVHGATGAAPTDSLSGAARRREAPTNRYLRQPKRGDRSERFGVVFAVSLYPIGSWVLDFAAVKVH